MTVGILGLGLIGGSLARAYAKAGHRVLAYDADSQILAFAQLSEVVSQALTTENLSECDLVLLSVYSDASAAWLEQNGEFVAKTSLVIDCCGIKEAICSRCFSVAEKYGFTYVGGHPMAGSHNSGFKYSRSNLFQGAPMVLVPPRYDDPVLLQRVKDALAPCGFKSYSVTTAKQHDKMIAFTSQMPHIISNAYIKSPTAKNHGGFSAGSYKDLTRVAWLNPEMWAELLLSNKDNVLYELDYYIKSLSAYRTAIENDNMSDLIALLAEGRRCKEEVDG
ncbi:MAG: prephenate dehydrogenase/arogenate dehydrogenase family protein [Oscillospiraceae bacterium]|nr:prephenate dehydrogenase/arogenate dehydrogenase family protein [Oscillospiraceae bacterium]